MPTGIMAGTRCLPGATSEIAEVSASHSGPAGAEPLALVASTTSYSISSKAGPIALRKWSCTSVSSCPGSDRTSISASARSATTLALTPLCNVFGLTVMCVHAWTQRASPMSSNASRSMAASTRSGSRRSPARSPGGSHPSTNRLHSSVMWAPGGLAPSAATAAAIGTSALAVAYGWLP